MAREGLTLHVYGMIKDGYDLPAPSRLEDIPLEKNEALALIETDDLDGYAPDWEARFDEDGEESARDAGECIEADT